MKQAAKSFANKVKQVPLDIAGKNREKIIKRQTTYLSYFNCKSYFDSDGLQNYLIFQPIYDTFKRPTGNTETIII